MRRILAATAASTLALASLSACGTPDYYIVQVTGQIDKPAAITVTADGVQLFASTDVPLPFAFQVKGTDATKGVRVQANAPDPEGVISCEIDSVTGSTDADVSEASSKLLVNGRIEVVCES